MAIQCSAVLVQRYNLPSSSDNLGRAGLNFPRIWAKVQNNYPSMTSYPSRRSFLKHTAAGTALLGLGDLGFISRLPDVSAAEAKLKPEMMRFSSNIEPLVRVLE